MQSYVTSWVRRAAMTGTLLAVSTSYAVAENSMVKAFRDYFNKDKTPKQTQRYERKGVVPRVDLRIFRPDGTATSRSLYDRRTVPQYTIRDKHNPWTQYRARQGRDMRATTQRWNARENWKNALKRLRIEAKKPIRLPGGTVVR